jgi:hypothetical protein
MHAERSENLPPEPPSGVERAVMMQLLTGEHALWTQAELEREVCGPRGNPVDAIDAIEHLYGRGPIHVFGEFVTPNRAARAMDELVAGV